MDIVTNTDMTAAILDSMLKSAPGSYTIYKKDSTIYGISNTPGYDDVTPDTDAHTVFQAVADALTAGGQIAIKGPATYDMQDDWKLTLGNYPLKIIGIGDILNTKLDYNNTDGEACIKPKNASANFWLEIENIHIDGYTAPTKTGLLLENDCSMGNFKRLRIIGFNSTGGKGIDLANGYYNTFTQCYVSWCRTGIKFGDVAGDTDANANQILGGFIQNFAYSDGIGLHLHGMTNVVIGLTIENFNNATAEGVKVDGEAGDLASDNVLMSCHFESSGTPIGIHMTNYAYRTKALECRDAIYYGASPTSFWKDDAVGGTANVKINGNKIICGAEYGFVIGASTGSPTDNVQIRNYADYLYLNTGAGIDLNDKILKDPKNDVDATLSGTPKVVEIKIGAVPYYFKVYPTKS